MELADLIIRRLNQLVTCSGPVPKRKEALKEIGLIEEAAIASYKGKIIYVGNDKDLEKNIKLTPETIILEAEGLVGFPGFIDPHTHLPFAGTREKEFVLRIKGASYQELASQGLGIQTTVRATREITKEKLIELCLERLDTMLRHGTTTVEAKSGYGLDWETEIKQLEVLNEVNQIHPIEIVPTYLGAHEVPPEYRHDKSKYLELLIKNIMPEIRRRKLAEFIDIFCEEGVYSLEETKKLAQEAKKMGFKIRLHADEFSPLGGAELAAELEASSADHLINVSDNGIEALASSSTVAILLPMVPLFLRLEKWPPARRLIEAGATVALATDFNPGSSMTECMPLVIQLAVFLLNFQIEEALQAATINAAFSLGRDRWVGSLEVGKNMDLVLCSMPNYLHLVYHPGPNLVRHVFKKGNWVVQDGQICRT
ncbi:MAG: imidazolonepropionase [Candidatus Aminicenantes bacterium]|nr:imidazolonepropionase [Candidatus Aminicenantes bacterium]